MFSSLEYSQNYTKWNPKPKTFGRALTLTSNETFNRLIELDIKIIWTNRTVRLRRVNALLNDRIVF